MWVSEEREGQFEFVEYIYLGTIFKVGIQLGLKKIVLIFTTGSS